MRQHILVEMSQPEGVEHQTKEIRLICQTLVTTDAHPPGPAMCVRQQVLARQKGEVKVPTAKIKLEIKQVIISAITQTITKVMLQITSIERSNFHLCEVPEGKL